MKSRSLQGGVEGEARGPARGSACRPEETGGAVMTQETPAVDYGFDMHNRFAVWEDIDLLILSCLVCGAGLPFSVAVGPAAVQEAIDAHLSLHGAAP